MAAPTKQAPTPTPMPPDHLWWKTHGSGRLYDGKFHAHAKGTSKGSGESETVRIPSQKTQMQMIRFLFFFFFVLLDIYAGEVTSSR